MAGKEQYLIPAEEVKFTNTDDCPHQDKAVIIFLNQVLRFDEGCDNWEIRDIRDRDQHSKKMLDRLEDWN